MPAPPDAEPGPSASRRWRVLALLALAELAAMCLWFSASAVVPQLELEWRLAPGERAWLTVAVQLGFVLGALGSAFTNLADRVPVPRLFGACGLAGAALTAAIPLSGVGFGGALVLRAATGVALAGVYPPGMKLAASWSSRDRGLAIGLLVGALTFGSALPHLLNALPLLGGAGLPPWRSILLGAAGIAALGALIVPLGVPSGPYLARSAPFDLRYVARSLASRPARLVNLGYLGHMWELYAMWTWVPLLLVASYEHAGWPLERARLAGFAAVAAGAPACLLAGFAADRVGRTAVASASLLVSGACCLVAGALFDSPAALTALCLLWGFAVVADSAQFSAALSELSDPRYVGTALALQTSLGFLLTSVTIRLVPALVERFGWRGALAVLALGPAVGIGAMLRLRAHPDARRMASGRR